MRKKSFIPLDKCKNTRKNYLTGFTILELIVVIIIIGILATLALNYFGPFRENTLDREAQANLRLILSAERILRMESNNNQYVAYATTQDINTNLRLMIPTTNPAWNYRVNIAAAGQQFAAQATRTQAPGRRWCIREPTVAIPDPQPTAGNCSF